MEEKEKVEATLSEEKNELTKEEEEAGDIHWKTKPDRNWMPGGGEEVKTEEALVDPAIAEQEEAEARLVLDEARSRAADVPEEEMHPDYKRMMGIGAVQETEEEKEEKVRYGKCGDCGAVVPVEKLQDNGSYIACPKCY